VGDQGKIIGISEFGTSAPYNEIYQHYGITAENIVSTAKKMLSNRQ
jgi:transketolase